MKNYKVNDHVRLYDYPEGDINEAARIRTIYENDDVFLTNMNMPYLGTINGRFSKEEFKRMITK